MVQKSRKGHCSRVHDVFNNCALTPFEDCEMSVEESLQSHPPLEVG